MTKEFKDLGLDGIDKVNAILRELAEARHNQGGEFNASDWYHTSDGEIIHDRWFAFRLDEMVDEYYVASERAGLDKDYQDIVIYVYNLIVSRQRIEFVLESVYDTLTNEIRSLDTPQKPQQE